MEKDLITLTEAGDICGVTRNTIWRWIKTGNIRAAATAGGHHRIRYDDLKNFIQKKNMSNRYRDYFDKSRILIVDDEPQIQKFLRKLLTARGFEVEIASDGFEAGILVMKNSPHLIILDLYMPNMNGFEVCKYLKNDPATRKIKIIAISGKNTEEDEAEILGLGADIFMPKPLRKNILLNEVLSLIELPGKQY